MSTDKIIEFLRELLNGGAELDAYQYSTLCAVIRALGGNP